MSSIFRQPTDQFPNFGDRCALAASRLFFPNSDLSGNLIARPLGIQELSVSEPQKCCRRKQTDQSAIRPITEPKTHDLQCTCPASLHSPLISSSDPHVHPTSRKRTSSPTTSRSRRYGTERPRAQQHGGIQQRCGRREPRGA